MTIFKDLVQLRGLLLSQVMALSTKLRIAPSSRNDYRRRLERGPRPWEVEEDLDPVN